MKNKSFVEDYKKRIEEILSKEVPYLEKVGYDESIGFFFNLSAKIELDTIHLENVLNANGLSVLSVMGLGDGSYIISPDVDDILDEEEIN